ncbi:hypothetical protein TNCT_696961 [Trichonephila clavata]|uniref:Secreted protein n=1 Tax=Trichonephila clavata TaxID=2740835 RepID=A0A8X6GFI7_TRICU|nr:hypothetical protein TNCT_696961 [Trichonephila clavata]
MPVAVLTKSLVISVAAWTPSSMRNTLHFSGCLDQKLGHISHCLDTIKCTYSAALQRLFGPKAWSYQSLPGHHQVYLQCCTSAAVWTKSLVISVTAWTPSSMRNALHFSGCLDQKLRHISHCLDTIKCTYSAALQRLFGPKASSYQSLSGHHQVYLQCCTSAAVWTKSLVISVTAWTPSSVLTVLHFSGCLDQKLGHISHCLDTIKCV